MSKKTFIIADLHLGHANICKFTNYDGSKLRPWDNVDDMDRDMIQMWNDTVSPSDKVYVLGDVVINRKALPTLGKLNGDKVLIGGNHDVYKAHDYLQYFRDIRAYHVLNNVIFSHIPIHPDSKGRFVGNIHGHLHSNRIKLGNSIDPWYYCVSAEHIGFKPILLETAIENLKNQQE